MTRYTTRAAALTILLVAAVGAASAGPLDWFTGSRAEPPSINDMQAAVRA